MSRFLKRYLHFFAILFVLLGDLTAVAAQNAYIRGHVVDASTGVSLADVSVSFPASGIGVSTDSDGYFRISADSVDGKLQFSLIGYKTVLRTVAPNKDVVFNIELISKSQVLSEQVVRPKGSRYRNKNNPAVELIESVIANKEKNRVSHYDYVAYNQYEKLTFYLSNTAEKLRNNFFFKKYKFITENLDTTTFEDIALMPWYMQELSSEVYLRSDPRSRRQYILGDKKVNFGKFVDSRGLNQYLKNLYQEVNIYDDNINLLTNQFLSPIASLAPTFYKFYITDTVMRDGSQWVELNFAPRNKEDMLFQGRIYVTLDGSFAVPEAHLTINPEINLNWVKDLDIQVDYKKGNDGRYVLDKTELLGSFGFTKNSQGGIVGKRVVSFADYKFTPPVSDTIFDGPEIIDRSVENAADSFWMAARHDTLSTVDQQTYGNINRLLNTPSFRRRMDLLTTLLGGYKTITPYVEAGPINTFYSFNPVEGFRLRFGARTTPQLSKRWSLDSYAAYGFGDQRWKYYFGGTYSFSNRSQFEFPQVLLKANFQRDTKIPGQELQFVQEDNFLLSFKRGNNSRWLYNDIYNVQFIHELPNHFSYQLNLKNWKQEPAGSLNYTIADGPNNVNVHDITTSEAGIVLRYAPHEAFYQGKKYRVPIKNKYPIFTFRGNFGIKGHLWLRIRLSELQPKHLQTRVRQPAWLRKSLCRRHFLHRHSALSAFVYPSRQPDLQHAAPELQPNELSGVRERPLRQHLL